MKRFLTATVALCLLMIGAGSARADRLGRLIRELKSNPSYKVRLTAVLGLSKYADPRAVKALISVVKKSKEDPRVRGFAAMGLGRLRAMNAVSVLRRAARDRNSFLKAKAKWALEHLCPSRLSGKRIYINMDKVRSSGPNRKVAQSIAVMQLAKVLARRSDVTTGWPGCKRPSARDLRRRRMKAYYFDTSVKVSNAGGRLTCRVSVLFTTYPGQSIKGNAGARAAVPGSASADTLSRLIEALVGHIRSDIGRFLDSQ